MSNKTVYFDNAATSNPKPDGVIKAICDCLQNANANPGRSGHTLSVKAAEIIYSTRELLGEFFHYPKTENIVLTKNATEALNIAIYGTLKDGDEVITTSMEHNSVMRPLNHLQSKGMISVKKLIADSNGVVLPQQISDAITDKTKLIIATSSSNVTGTKLDMKGIWKVAHSSSVKLLVDGAQGAGSMKINLEETPFDLFATTGHKHLFGPQGTGVLIVKDADELDSFMRGGTGSMSERPVHPDFPPDKFEAGTPNTPGYAGLAEGVRFLLKEGIDRIVEKEQHLVEYLLEKLRGIDEVLIYAPDADRVATVSFNIEGATPSDVSHYLDTQWGIYVRPGLHCSPEAHKTLNTFPGGTIRFSLSCFNTKEEIDIAITALKSYVRDISPKSAF
ncbi:MAG TPA: cysteine desulfurase [Thermodesulfovibrionales bacterium]|nr:cysteine desulfurase [Thermodesulfovibrionales bacterium]